MACDRAYCVPGAGGRGWPREGLRGRHTGPGADGEALGAARGWLPGAPTCRARRRSRGGVLAAAQLCEGGWGVGALGAVTEQSLSHVCTHCADKPATRLGFRLPSAQVVEAHHTVRPRPPLRSPAAASCARAGDSVRGVDMCRSCIDEGDGNAADTGLSRWRAAGRTHCASAHGARCTQSGPPSLKHSD